VTHRNRLCRTSIRGLVVAIVLVSGGRQADAQRGNALVTSGSAVPHTRYVPGTLIPRLAMGVRQRVRDADEAVELRDRPEGDVVGRHPLFTPLYVHDEQRHGSENWLLLAATYRNDRAAPRGWVRRSKVEVFGSRYGYAIHEPGVQAEFFPTPADAYTIVPGFGPEGDSPPSRLATVLGRAGAAGWRPVRRTDRMPFMELEFERLAGYPSTTPSSTPYDGRLVRVGAICGGPVDDAVLAKLQAEAERNAAVDMLFVVDETGSMKDYFGPVADFIRDVGKAAGDGLIRRPRIAVSYYSDGPPGVRTKCAPLQQASPAVVETLVKSVRTHEPTYPPGDYIEPPERMLDGMRDAIRKADFTEGVTSIVAVIGDTGHEPKDDREKQKLFDEVAGLVIERGLMVFFVHVGLTDEKMNGDQALFKQDALTLRERVGRRKKGFSDLVRYTKANAGSLSAELEASRREVDRLVERAQLTAERITSRNTDTIPGPAVIAAMAKDGITLAEFDEGHQQLYVPSYVWLVSPRGAVAKPKQAAQLGRHFFIAPEEAAAVVALLESVSRDVEAGVEVGHDRAVQAFVKSLGASVNDVAGVQAVEAAWAKQGPNRTSGTFLGSYVGLDLRDEVLFSQGPLGTTQESVAARKAFTAMATAFGKAARDEGRFWFDAAFAVP
jgi:hypothetical protein